MKFLYKTHSSMMALYDFKTNNVSFNVHELCLKQIALASLFFNNNLQFTTILKF